eukprot:14663-Prymnesium_polylepis.2
MVSVTTSPSASVTRKGTYTGVNGEVKFPDTTSSSGGSSTAVTSMVSVAVSEAAPFESSTKKLKLESCAPERSRAGTNATAEL